MVFGSIADARAGTSAPASPADSSSATPSTRAKPRATTNSRGTRTDRTATGSEEALQSRSNPAA